jgi:hypothetical protein
MPQAETFLVRAQTGPEGVVIGDVVLKTADGGILPAIVKTGYTFNLEQVDLASFAQSARRGMLAAMEESGSVVRVMAEVREKTYDALQAELAKFPKLRKDGPYAHATQVVSIEPGMMVAVGGAPQAMAQQMLPVAGAQQPVAEANQVAQPSSFADPMLQAGAQNHAPTPAAGATEDDANNAVTSWKDGKTLPEQEDFIKASTDKVFLQSIIDDKNEPKKMQRLAKARLAELE